jgi:hypothetical protein
MHVLLHSRCGLDARRPKTPCAGEVDDFGRQELPTIRALRDDVRVRLSLARVDVSSVVGGSEERALRAAAGKGRQLPADLLLVLSFGEQSRGRVLWATAASRDLAERLGASLRVPAVRVHPIGSLRWSKAIEIETGLAHVAEAVMRIPEALAQELCK